MDNSMENETDNTMEHDMSDHFEEGASEGDEDKKAADLNNLIINYLPETMTQEDLHKMFASFGDIESCKLIRDKAKGHSLGYGFVKFMNKDHAQNALNNLDGLMLQHKKIKVSFARPANEPIKTANVYVSGLKNTISEAELISIFSVYGKVLTVKLKNNDGDNRRANAIGFVRFEQFKCAEKAIGELDQTRPLNNPNNIRVSFAKQAKETNPPPYNPKPNFLNPTPSFAGFGSGILNSRKPLLPFPSKMAETNFGKTTSFTAKNMRFDPLGKNNIRSSLGDGMFGGNDPYYPSGGHDGKGFTLFVFNLNPDCEEVKLWRLFGPFGAVNDVKIIVDKDTNKGKGFAFVSMPNYREAQIAIDSLNQTTFDGKVLQVSFKKEKIRN